MKKIKLIISFYITCNLLFIAKIHSQNVNEFTGGFSYSVPLMTVPSPYGPGVSIGAGYGAGIGVNQSASEIGLGWGINLGGVISRNVSGIPDDWNGPYVADPQNAGIKSQGGVMYFNNHTNRDNMDFYKSTYNIDGAVDKPSFYFPDYDNYSVSGPGIGGSLQPHLFDFATTELNVFTATNLPATQYTMDATYDFNKRMEFNFGGDYAGNFKSRHYPSNPINSGTTLRYPGYNDTVTDTEFTSSTIPYTGIDDVDFNRSTNRLATAKYVEYFTNTEVNTPDSTGFLNIPASPTRTSTDYEMDGIGAFRITDESGFVYYYTQPVYINSATFGNYPLNNDYSPKVYDGEDDTLRITDISYPGNYFIQDVDLTSKYGSPFMVEWKQNKKYAYNWLLTAVTGPDYVDSDANGIVNSADKGYWIIYDWQLWTKNFTRRSPEYGFDYSFNADENDNTQDLDIADADKISGKFGTFSKYNQEIYYLNKVQTASHTAVMVRDVRLDGHGSEPYAYDGQNGNSFNILTEDTETKTSNYGTLYDDGGASADYGINKNPTITISPAGASSITIRFNSFVMAEDEGDKVIVKDGSGNVLATYTHDYPPALNSNITFNYSTIKINEVTNSTLNAAGFRLGWLAKHPTVIPQLKLSRITLFKNEDFSTLQALSYSSPDNYVTTSENSFDIANVGKDKFYNETWYAVNLSDIESKSLQTIEFKQDYSLSKKYVNNIKTTVCATDKLSSPSDVVNGITTETADYASSGKLTLNEILTYNVGHEKTAPSVVFDYHKSSTDDNPDYNPVKIDYSGFYKNDASAQGYSSYTSETSKLYTDAWSLRKIMSPMGGSVEMNYESNEYEKVFDGDGGFRGPSKMYMIKSIALPSGGSTRYGIDWEYALEEDVTTPSEFSTLKANPPTGTIKHAFIPFIDPTNSPPTDQKFVNTGTFTFSSSGSELTSFQKLFDASPINSRDYIQDGTDGNIDNSNIFSSNLKYTGNGYIHFDLPVGTVAYGGGIRVRSIITRNETTGPTDAYTQEYTYSGGVSPMEFDRFAEEKLGNLSYSSDNVNIKLRPAAYDHHRMGPGIGYTSVTVKNKGQNDVANGSSTKTFITSDAGIDNYKTNIELRTSGSDDCVGVGYCPCPEIYIDSAYMIEVVDKFSGYWGQVQSMQTVDINDNILSKTVNTYSNLNQGTVVENYNFLTKIAHAYGSPGPGSVCTQHNNIVCIKRQYPVILSKQTVYSQGTSAITEYLTFDPITGGATEVRSTSPNEGITINRSGPAFRISEYSAMGPKSVTASNANILSPTAYSKTTVDSTLSGSSDFANYSVQTFKEDFKIRKYNSDTALFINDPQTGLYWIADRSYNWAGDSTSLDDYGLFKQSQLTAAPFDYTLASIDNKWRFASENTLLDNSGHILEVKAFNNRFSAKKYGYADKLQIAEASNVNYASFTYSGFESTENNPSGYIDGEVKMNYGTKVSTVPAHTGTYELKVPSGATIANAHAPVYSAKYYAGDKYRGLLKERIYRASVWVHSSSNNNCKLSVSFAGGTAISIAKSSALNITVGDWILMNVDIEVTAAAVNGNLLKVYLESPDGDAYFDDLRLHPVDAAMSATVYDPVTNRVSAKLDGNNFATKYIYDAGGRVLEVWQEIEGMGLKKMKRYQYNYARGL